MVQQIITYVLKCFEDIDTSRQLDREIGVHTANGPVSVSVGATSYNPFLNEYITGLSLPGCPNLLSLGQLVNCGFHFEWDPNDFQKPKLRRIDTGTSIPLRVENFVPMIDQFCSVGAANQNYTAHCPFTHLGDGKKCDTCLQSKTKARPATSRDPTLEQAKHIQNEALAELKFSVNLTCDTIICPKDIHGNRYGLLVYDQTNHWLWYDDKAENDDTSSKYSFVKILDPNIL